MGKMKLLKKKKKKRSVLIQLLDIFLQNFHVKTEHFPTKVILENGSGQLQGMC